MPEFLRSRSLQKIFHYAREVNPGGTIKNTKVLRKSAKEAFGCEEKKASHDSSGMHFGKPFGTRVKLCSGNSFDETAAHAFKDLRRSFVKQPCLQQSAQSCPGSKATIMERKI